MLPASTESRGKTRVTVVLVVVMALLAVGVLMLGGRSAQSHGSVPVQVTDSHESDSQTAEARTHSPRLEAADQATRQIETPSPGQATEEDAETLKTIPRSPERIALLRSFLESSLHKFAKDRSLSNARSISCQSIALFIEQTETGDVRQMTLGTRVALSQLRSLGDGFYSNGCFYSFAPGTFPERADLLSLTESTSSGQSQRALNPNDAAAQKLIFDRIEARAQEALAINR